jgi:hypothetical protein
VLLLKMQLLLLGGGRRGRRGRVELLQLELELILQLLDEHLLVLDPLLNANAQKIAFYTAAQYARTCIHFFAIWNILNNRRSIQN